MRNDCTASAQSSTCDCQLLYSPHGILPHVVGTVSRVQSVLSNKVDHLVFKHMLLGSYLPARDSLGQGH